jgi:predicted RNA-binding Zn-ribbon protein involved in translation (DUF1610 family)
MKKQNGVWRCDRCGKELVIQKRVFHYLKHSFMHEVLCCPMCGSVLIQRELAEGKMAQVEKMLEEK